MAGDITFVWPRNVFAANDHEREQYNKRVKDFVNDARELFPLAWNVYNEPESQRIIFAKNKFAGSPRNVRQKLYNMALPYYNNDLAERLLRYIRSTMGFRNIININFGFIHSTRNPDLYVFRYPSNNTRIMPFMERINHLDDVEKLRTCLDAENVFEVLHDRFSVDSRSVQIIRLVCLQVEVWETDETIGNGAIDDAPYLWTFADAPADNLCAYRAFAAASFETQPTIKCLYERVEQIRSDVKKLNLLEMEQNKFYLPNTSVIEDLLKKNIRWYDKSGKEVASMWSTKNLYAATPINILVDNEHCAFISDYTRFAETIKGDPFCDFKLSVGCGRWFLDKHTPWYHGASVWTFTRSPKNATCFARALASHRLRSPQLTAALATETNRIIQQAQQANLTLPSPNEKQLDIAKTWLIEDLFHINIRYHFLTDYMDVVYSGNVYPDHVYVAVSSGHYAYIKNLALFTELFVCPACGRTVSSQMHKHLPRCKGHDSPEKNWRFVKGLDRPKPDMWTTLEHLENAFKQVHFIQRFIGFDIESMLALPDAAHFNSRVLIAHRARARAAFDSLRVL